MDTDPENFNCVSVEIDTAVLIDFVQAVKTKQMKPVGGFFFGNTNYDPAETGQMQDDLQFASEVWYHLLLGRKVHYSSWW